MKVILTRSEMAQAQQAAALRWQLARAANVSDKLIGKNHDPADIDLVGIKAEIAVAKLFKAEFNPNSLGIDSGVDLFLRGLRKEVGVQVKTSVHKNAEWLLVEAGPDTDWDVAILVLPTDMDEVMELAGCIGRNRCIDMQEKVDLGHGPGIGVRAGNLNRIENLWRSINA